ncbi:MAG TPA: hypothetical protein VD735_05505 [Candidatus Saccharimonadales bacterium]|nr:hypothetical protein [Candidatus Saccharimonadales bacterium]
MEHYLRKLKHLQHSGHGGDHSRTLKKVKKIVIIVVIFAIVATITLIVLAIMAISWLFNRGGDEIKQAGQNVVQQVQPEINPLNLESYVTDGVVNAEQLEQTFTSVPTQLQDAWLAQFKTQLDDLQNQAGVSDETIQSLTSLYNTFQQLQG